MTVVKGIVGGVIVGGLVYSLTEPFRYIVKRYEIRHKNIPNEFNGYRIVFLADIHYGRTSKGRFLTKIVNRVNQFRPDLVLLGGDYITHRKYIGPCFQILKGLKAREGIYAVLGNHDVVEGEAETLYHLRAAGIKCLTNDAVWIGGKQKIKIGGVGDLWTQTQDLNPLINDLSERDYSILITHNPKYIYHLQENSHVALALAGHTHGGQFAPMKYLQKIVPTKVNSKIGLDYLSGKYTKSEMDIIVSNGVGTAKFPLRFMTPPEIIEITLKS